MYFSIINLSFLKDIQALKDTDVGSGQPNTFTLTPLGRHLAELPCSPKIGRLLVYGTLLGCTGWLEIYLYC
jgi:HrpA-like RNA helicase